MNTMTMRDVQYRLAKTRTGEPLVILESPMGNGQEITPTDLRALAATLLQIASSKDAHDGKTRQVTPRHEYAKHELYALIDSLTEMERL